MTASGVGIMDKWAYMHILKQNWKQSAANLKMPLVYKFQQDNDPKHAAVINMMWLIYKLLRTLP
jgi:hypothetical protein